MRPEEHRPSAYVLLLGITEEKSRDPIEGLEPYLITQHEGASLLNLNGHKVIAVVDYLKAGALTLK